MGELTDSVAMEQKRMFKGICNTQSFVEMFFAQHHRYLKELDCGVRHIRTVTLRIGPLSNNCRCWRAYIDKNSLFSLRRACLRVGPTRAGQSHTAALPDQIDQTLPNQSASSILVCQKSADLIDAATLQFFNHKMVVKQRHLIYQLIYSSIFCNYCL